MTTLILIRGLPGSGKSYLAKRLKGKHFEADMYFIDSAGRYEFNPDQLKAAHAWCLGRTRLELSVGFNVIVSNTFSQNWEMEPYLKAAQLHKATVQVIECQGSFGSTHNVPQAVIEKMRARWEAFTPLAQEASHES